MKTSGTNTSATGHKGGLGDGLYDRAGARPDLDLDFARTKSLKDRVSKEDLITFTRASGTGYGATYVDENGLVKRSPVNWMFDSENLSAGSYSTYSYQGVISANAGTSPTGNSSYAHIGQGNTGRHSLTIKPSANNTNFVIASNTRFVMSLFIKRLSGDSIERYVNLETANYGTWTYTGNSGTFDLVNGTRVSDPTNSNITSGIEDVGDGWYRIHFSSTTGTSDKNTGFYLNSTNSTSGGSPSLTLTSSQGYLVWGVQVEEGSSVPTTYIPTSAQRRGAPRFTHDPVTKESKGLLIEQEATNVWLNSQDVNSWTTVSAPHSPPTVDSNSALAPDGTQTADKVTFANTTTYWAIRYQGIYTGTYTWSGWIKTADNTTKDIYLSWASPDPNRVHTFTATGEWQRFEAVVTPASANVHLGNHRDLTPSSWNGGEFYIWGVQMEAGSVATSYIPTSGSTVTRSPDLVSIEGDNFGTYRLNQCKDSEPNALNFDETTLIAHAYDTVSPDGNFNASLLTEDTSGPGTHLVRWDPIPSLEDSTNYTVSCHFKEPSTNSRRYAGLTMHNRAYVVFDLQTGTHVLTQNSSKGFVSQSITPVGETDSNGKPVNGWYRCSATFTTETGQGNAVYAFLSSTGQNNGQTYTGDGVSGMYVWGYQCEKGNTLTPYIPSTDTYTNRQSNATFVDGNGIIRMAYKNWITNSEAITNSNFGSNHLTLTSSTTDTNFIAPDGTFTASKAIPNNNHAQHNFFQAIPSDLQNGTVSIFAKAGELSHISVISQSLNNNSTESRGVSFNLSNGTIHDSYKATGEIIDVGNGWYRCICKPETNDVGNRHAFSLFDVHNGETPDHSNKYRIFRQGNGTDGAYVWGAMNTNDNTNAGDYYKTTGTRSGPPRYSHDPETLTPTGLYLEPAATNYVTYSQPTSGSNWDTLGGNTTVTGSYAEAPDGTQTAVRVQMPDDNGTVFRTSVSVVSGTTYTFSVYLKSNHATLNTINVQVFNAGVTVDEAVTLTNEWVRYSRTFTATVTGNAEIGFDNGPIEVDFLFWGAQVEVGSIATSYIPTSGAEVTRSADTFTSTATEVLDRANGTKPAFYTKNGLTAFVRGTNQPNPPTYAFRFLEFTGGHSNGNADLSLTSNSNGTKIGVFQHTATTHATEPQGIGSSQTSPNTTLGLDNKMAVRYQTDNTRLYVNSEEGPLVDSSYNNGIDARSSNRLCIGANGGASGVGTSRILNGTIKRLTFWKTPFTDSKLDKLTTAIT
jgi:hypothetical protein